MDNPHTCKTCAQWSAHRVRTHDAASVGTCKRLDQYATDPGVDELGLYTHETLATWTCDQYVWGLA